MADTKQSPPRQTMKDFVRKPPSEAPGPAHACDAPGLAAKEFLYAIYRDPRLPMSTRIQAAKELLPFTESIPKPVVQGPTITIVIGGLKAPEQINEKSQLKEFLRADNCQPRCGDPGPSNTEMNSNPPTPKPFLSTPGPSYIEKTLERLSLSEIIKIVANTPEHLLPTCTLCGHPVMFPCSVDPHPPPYTDPFTLPCVIRHTRTGETVH